jgi:hypothetical protein
MTQVGPALLAYYDAMLAQLSMKSWAVNTENQLRVDGFKSLRPAIEQWSVRENTVESKAKWLGAGLVFYNGINDFARWLGQDENTSLKQAFADVAGDIRATGKGILTGMWLLLALGVIAVILVRVSK